jgi:hypothetical protein
MKDLEAYDKVFGKNGRTGKKKRPPASVSAAPSSGDAAMASASSDDYEEYSDDSAISEKELAELMDFAEDFTIDGTDHRVEMEAAKTVKRLPRAQRSRPVQS